MQSSASVPFLDRIHTIQTSLHPDADPGGVAHCNGVITIRESPSPRRRSSLFKPCDLGDGWFGSDRSSSL
jgi:hypothetical protein